MGSGSGALASVRQQADSWAWYRLVDCEIGRTNTAAIDNQPRAARAFLASRSNRSRLGVKSIQCSSDRLLSCAIFLSKWLRSVATCAAANRQLWFAEAVHLLLRPGGKQQTCRKERTPVANAMWQKKHNRRTAADVPSSLCHARSDY